MKDTMLGNYIAKTHSTACLTEHELTAIKNGDMDELASVFIDMKNDTYKMQLKSVLKSFKLYMKDSISLEDVRRVEDAQERYIGCQIMDGDEDVFLGIGGNDEALRKVASKFARCEFEQFDEDAYDAVCELINCTNGMLAVKLDEKDIQCELRPPVFYKDVSVKSSHPFYVLDFKLDGQMFSTVMAIEDVVNIERWGDNNG
jgi:hypothetical protein